MAKMHSPVDGMFRAGQISSKEWARLHPTEHGKGGKTHGRMANFDEKTRNEGAGRLKGPQPAGNRHIDHKQTMGKAAHAGGKPPFGGMASKGPTPDVDQIEQASMQKPMFPAGGGKKGKAVTGGTTQAQGPQYGGGNGRGVPQRI